MKKLFCTFLVLSFPLTSFAFNSEVVFNKETKTIKELKQDLENIKKEEKEVKNKIKHFIQDSKLGTYLKKDLGVIELKHLENIIAQYNIKRQEIKGSNRALYNNELLSLKINLYKDFTQFIAPENYNFYLGYVEADTKILKEQKNIVEKKLDTQYTMDKRVQVLEEKIEKHKTSFQKVIESLIEKKVEEKIISIFTSEKFRKLEYRDQIKIFSNTLEKIRVNLEKIRWTLWENDNLVFEASIEQKIEVYKITLEKIKNFRERVIRERKE